jgi:hypothetical protein
VQLYEATHEARKRMHHGEGLIFDLRLSYCVGELPMEVLQHSTCVTHWTHGDDVNIILRKNGEDDLWCLRY